MSISWADRWGVLKNNGTELIERLFLQIKSGLFVKPWDTVILESSSWGPGTGNTGDEARWQGRAVVKLGAPALRKLLGCGERRERKDHGIWGKYRYPVNDVLWTGVGVFLTFVFVIIFYCRPPLRISMQSKNSLFSLWLLGHCLFSSKSRVKCFILHLLYCSSKWIGCGGGGAGEVRPWAVSGRSREAATEIPGWFLGRHCSPAGGVHSQECSWVQGASVLEMMRLWFRIVFLKGRKYFWWGHGFRKMVAVYLYWYCSFISTWSCSTSDFAQFMWESYTLEVFAKERNHQSPLIIKLRVSACCWPAQGEKKNQPPRLSLLPLKSHTHRLPCYLS